jgi:hypothetical protein
MPDDEAAKEIRRAFALGVRQRPLGGNVGLRYVVVGGVPGNRLELRISVDPVNGIRIEGHDQRATVRPIESQVSLREFDVSDLFEQVASSLHSLTPASRFRSLPDALVGKLVISVDGKEEAFGFIPEEEKRRTRRAALPPPMETALQHLWTIGMRALTTPQRHKGA